MFDNHYHTRIVWSIPKMYIDHRLPKATDISRTDGKWPSRFNEVYLAVVVCPSNSSRFPVPSSIAVYPLTRRACYRRTRCNRRSTKDRRWPCQISTFRVKSPHLRPPGSNRRFRRAVLCMHTDAQISRIPPKPRIRKKWRLPTIDCRGRERSYAKGIESRGSRAFTPCRRKHGRTGD